jgi:serine O-acetyltransferase
MRQLKTRPTPVPPEIELSRTPVGLPNSGLDQVVQALCEPSSYEQVVHVSGFHVPMPSLEALAEVLDRLRSILFPGYFGSIHIRPDNIRYHTGTLLDRLHELLTEQVKRGLCFECTSLTPDYCGDCEIRSRRIAESFLAGLPHLRQLLATDVEAAYSGDPAARNRGEVIFCYPSLRAVTHYRIAHALHQLGVPIIPRIIAERAHSETGIDIHPGAEIGEYFFIDHGTGVVVGETCVIGRNVRIYQGVTLGAKSFPLDPQGRPIKGIPRHPIVEDDVIIYSGATILGRITIGRGSVIGGNVWLTQSVPPRTRVVQGKSAESSFENGSGI